MYLFWDEARACRCLPALGARAGRGRLGRRPDGADGHARLRAPRPISSTRTGPVLSLTLTCTASAACTCEGSTKLAYRSEAHLPGNGAPGRESGSLVASGPTGSVTLIFNGTRTALGQGSGTWTLGQVTGFHGVRLATRGSYTTQTKTLQSVTGTMNTVVSVTGSYGCWNCAG